MCNKTILYYDIENTITRYLLNQYSLEAHKIHSYEAFNKLISLTHPKVIIIYIESEVRAFLETHKGIFLSTSTEKFDIIFITKAALENEVFELMYAHPNTFIINNSNDPILTSHMIEPIFKLIYKYNSLLKNQEKLLTKNEQLKSKEVLEHYSATHDYLTKLINRRQLDIEIKKLYKQSFRTKSDISILMIDLDNFKGYNDCYGHVHGDLALQKIASAILSCCNRPLDIVGRYGGEEFLVILPNTTTIGAKNVASSILNAVENLEIEHCPKSKNKYLTVSIGIASIIPTTRSNFEDLIMDADRQMYKAKRLGRNRFHYNKNPKINN